MMDARVPIRKLDVKNFAERTTSEDLRNYFSKYGNVESCYLRENRGKSNCAVVTFTNVADAVRAMLHGKRERLHNRDLTVKAFWLQPHKYLQNDTKSVSIHMLNDHCLKCIFQFLPIVDRIRIERVCKRWRDLSQDSWHMLKTLDLLPYTMGFSYAHKIHTDSLHKILLKCGRFLTQINVNHMHHNLSQSTLTIIGKLCPNLTSIDLRGLINYASDIRTLANNCRNITKFNLGYTRDRCDDELEYFFKQNQNLEYVVISSNDFYGDALLCLPEQTMHTIILNYCDDIQNNFLSMALKKLGNLKHLTIFRCDGLNEYTLQAVGQHCKNLRALELDCFDPLTDISYLNLIRLVDLQILKITYNIKLSDYFLVDLVKHCQQLTNLDITCCVGVTDAGLAVVATLVNLEKLNVSYLDKITDDGLKNMRGLKELECQKCLFTDRGMSRFISSSPQLQLLDLTECRNITDTTLEVAKHACSNRTNNVMLKMIVNGTAILTTSQERLPPLLHIVKPVKPWWEQPAKNN